MKSLLNQLVRRFLISWSYIYSNSRSQRVEGIKDQLYTIWLSREFNRIGSQTKIKYSIKLVGGKSISLGKSTVIGRRTVLTAWQNVNGEKFHPKIIIGDNTNIGDDSHITAIAGITIGNGVLTGKKITITDNAHGNSVSEILSIPPNKRPLFSKGEVIIENNVWIGEKVTILPGVRIGQNSIIGANSVVTKDVQSGTVVAGIPAKIIKEMFPRYESKKN